MPPTLGTVVETHSTALPRAASTVVTSASFTPSAGDLLVVKAGTWSGSVGTSAISGGGLLWSNQDQSTGPNASSNTTIYTAQVGPSPSAMTVSVTFTVTTVQIAAYGMASFVVECWSTAALNPIPVTNHVVGTTTTSSTITPSVAGSVISFVDADYNGASGTPAYLGGATQTASYLNPTHLGCYYAYETTSSTSPLTYGMSAPTGQLATLAAIEILPVTNYAAVASLAGAGKVTVNAVARAKFTNQFFPVMPC